MITIVKKLDRTYGGYDYIEYDSSRKVFKTGQTRAHRGHYRSPSGEMTHEVLRLKDLKEVKDQLIAQGYTEDKEWEQN